MKKYNKKQSRLKCVRKISQGMTALDIHNAQNYLEDYQIINRMSFLPPSKREWIEVTRYELMAKPTQCECIVGKYLLDKKVRFVHQNPFVINGKIYFADFYIPQKHCLIEVDGWSHKMMTKRDGDRDRDNAFRYIGIPTIRIDDATCKNPRLLDALMQSKGIVPVQLSRKQQKQQLAQRLTINIVDALDDTTPF